MEMIDSVTPITRELKEVSFWVMWGILCFVVLVPPFSAVLSPSFSLSRVVEAHFADPDASSVIVFFSAAPHSLQPSSSICCHHGNSAPQVIRVGTSVG